MNPSTPYSSRTNRSVVASLRPQFRMQMNCTDRKSQLKEKYERAHNWADNATKLTYILAVITITSALFTIGMPAQLAQCGMLDTMAGITIGAGILTVLSGTVAWKCDRVFQETLRQLQYLRSLSH